MLSTECSKSTVIFEIIWMPENSLLNAAPR